MNRSALPKALNAAKAVQAALLVRSSASLLKLSRADAAVASLLAQERDLLSYLKGIEGLFGSDNKVLAGDSARKRGVWLLVAPDYSSARTDAVNYRELFIERVTATVMPGDAVIAVGKTAVDVAERVGYGALFTDSVGDLTPARRAELALLATELAIAQFHAGAGFVGVLALASGENIVRPILPLRQSLAYANATPSSFRCRIGDVGPSRQHFLAHAAGLVVAIGMELALAEGYAFRDRLDYHSLLASADRVDGEVRSLTRALLALNIERQLDEQAVFAANRGTDG